MSMRLKAEDFSIEAIAESGQTFRIVKNDNDAWRVTAFGKVLDIREAGNGEYELSCTDEEFAGIWRGYFDLDTDYKVYRSLALP